MNSLTTSVLIPSFRRPRRLVDCLRSLARQSRPPEEVIVVWQADDTPTREAAEAVRDELPCRLHVLHSPEAGVVPAENRALDAASGQILLLIDDDAVAPPDWVARHLAHYDDPRVGAVGGPADNSHDDGTLILNGLRIAKEPVGHLTWFGRLVGNMWNQPEAWRARPPREVDHLVGYNLSLRREAFDRFEAGLLPYWQMFEADACLQVKARGYRVLFDFGNVVIHYPSNQTGVYTFGRDTGDLRIKVYHGAFNQAFVLGKHSPAHLRPWRLLYLFGVGTVNAPGLVTFPLAVKRYGKPGRELRILLNSARFKWSGWRAGSRARRQSFASAMQRNVSVPQRGPEATCEPPAR